MRLNRKFLNKGDVLTVEFSFNDQQTSKLRPAVITQVSEDNIVIAKVTSKIKNHPNNISLTDIKAAGLERESQVQCNRQVTLNRYSTNIVSKIGHLTDHDLSLIKQKTTELQNNKLKNAIQKYCNDKYSPDYNITLSKDKGNDYTR